MSFNLAEFNARTDEYLGTTVFWTVHAKHVPVDMMDEAALRHGFTMSDHIKPPTNKKAFTRAVRRVGKRSGSLFARTISDRPGATVIGIVSEHRDVGAEMLDYEQTTTAKLFKDTSTVEVRGDHAPGFREDYDHYQEFYTDSDVRFFIGRVVASIHGVPLRKTGGVYFVPRDRVSTLVALDNLLKELGLGMIYQMRVPKGVEEARIAWESVEASARDEIEKVLAAVRKIAKSPKCLQNRADMLEAERMTVEAYVSLTDSEARAEAIRDMFQGAEDEITQRLIEIKSR